MDGAVTFGILGPLVVRGDDGEIAIGGRLRRRLLGMLLANGGERMSTDMICDAVWDGEPPARAPKTVRTYLTQLRRLPIPAPGLIVDADADGYRVELDRSVLDATRFEDLVEQARSTDGARRLALLDDAVGLWRGAVLDEFRGSAWADDVARPLERLRVAASQDRYELHLESGRAADVVGGLETDFIAAPLDERYGTLLARATYQSGDVDGALRVLGRLRRALAEELGLEPGPETTDLEHRMLERDPSLSPRGRQTAADAGTEAERVLPTGTVTFLFTDIEGSTALLQRVGDETYVSLLQQHRRAITDAVDEHGGVVFGTEGDALFCAFEDAGAAVDAALGAQRRLNDEDFGDGVELCVRMGLHTGHALIIGDDYAGATLHVVARVSAAAHGGQVIATDATRSIAGGGSWESLGRHRLRDVEGAVELHQAQDPDDPQTFTPLRTAQNVPTNLPESRDDFVGRVEEVAQIGSLLTEHPMVTLVGPGGVGKTRLATEAGHGMKPAFAGGAYLVELANAAVDADVATAVDRVLRGTDLQSLDAAVDRVSTESPVLLILDNCEQVLDGVAVVADRLAISSAAVSLLCTSREAVAIRAEHVVNVNPLGVDGVDSEAVRLFCRRAVAVTGRDLLDTDLAMASEICGRLDGLPLAIELAASRLRGLSIVDVARRLDDRFALLQSDGRDLSSRHRTLEAVIAWSHEGLSIDDRTACDRLGIFDGSFGLEVAEEVVSGDGFERRAVLGAITRLVDKSLLQRLPDDPGSRYRMLESVRQFGLARLGASEQIAVVQDRLVAWGMRMVDRLEVDLRTERQDAALATAVAEQGVLRTALSLLLDREDWLAAMRLVAAAPLDVPATRLALLADLLDRSTDVGTDVLVRAHLAAASLEFDRGRSGVGYLHAVEAEALAGTAGDRRSAAWAGFLQSFTAWGEGREEVAREAITRSIDRFRDLRDDLGIANGAWAAVLLTEGVDEADRLGEEAVAANRRAGTPFSLAHSLEASALVKIRSGDFDAARRLLDEALGLYAAGGNPGCVAHGLDAIAAALAHDPAAADDLAAELLGAASGLRRTSGHEKRPWELSGRDAAKQSLRTRLDGDVLDDLQERGAGHTVDTAAELGRRAASTRR